MCIIKKACSHTWCDANKKKICALRKYFLEHQKQMRRELKDHPELWQEYIYYYKKVKGEK